MPDWSFVTPILTTPTEICALASTANPAAATKLAAARRAIVRIMFPPVFFYLACRLDRRTVVTAA